MMSTQLRLFPLPRRLDPGEAHRCLDCGELDPRGSYGPDLFDEVRLEDGSTASATLRDYWFCTRHARTRWNEWTRRQAALPARRLRLRAFRIAAAHGYHGAEQFAVAEAWLRTNTVPEE